MGGTPTHTRAWHSAPAWGAALLLASTAFGADPVITAVRPLTLENMRLHAARALTDLVGDRLGATLLVLAIFPSLGIEQGEGAQRWQAVGEKRVGKFEQGAKVLVAHDHLLLGVEHCYSARQEIDDGLQRVLITRVRLVHAASAGSTSLV